MDLSIIIVSYNSRDKLKANLQAIFQSQGSFQFEIIVVDNASSDNSVEMVRKFFPQITLIANQENLGFAKANNEGLKKVRGEYVLLLNPDMLFFPETLANILDWMRANPQADVAGCHLVTESNEIIKHVRRFPTVLNQLAIILKLPHLFPWILKNYIREDFDYEKPALVDSVRGGFFMMNARPGHKIPLWLDERYFLWFEEVDYCRKIKKAGGQVWYTPVAKCVDYVGQSFKQLPRLEAQKYFRDSMLEYFKKWHPAWEYWLLKIIWPLGLAITALAGKINYKAKQKT